MSGSITSAAYGAAFRLYALVLVVVVGGWFARFYASGVLTGNASWSASNGVVWLGLAYAVMLCSLVAIFRSKTTLTDTELTQTWIWKKRVARADMMYARLVRVRGAEWLIAPRLYVKAGGRVHAFYACEQPMLHAYETIAAQFSSRP